MIVYALLTVAVFYIIGLLILGKTDKASEE